MKFVLSKILHIFYIYCNYFHTIHAFNNNLITEKYIHEQNKCTSYIIQYNNDPFKNYN